MKRVFLTGLILVFLCSILPVSAAQNPVSVYVDNSPISFDVPPVIENGRTLVPIRAIFEALNANVEWDNNTQTVTATTEYLLCIELQIGNPVATKYFLSPSVDFNFETNVGTYQKDQLQEITLDVPAKIIDGRTMVPLRFIAESMGCDVQWDGANQRVEIATDVGSEFLTTHAAVNLVCQYISTNGLYMPSIVECDSEDDVYYYIHAYDLMDIGTEYEHTATSGWYTVNKLTSEVLSML